MVTSVNLALHSTVFINGEWISGPQENQIVNPANKEIVGTYTVATKEQAVEAIQSAQAAFLTWKTVPLPERAKVLQAIIVNLKNRKEELAQMMTLEMGKVLRESQGEIDVVIQTAEYLSGEGKRAIGEVIPSNFDNRVIQVVREPIGVVSCITPWNFPVSLAAYKIFAALISGNTVVWKPASEVALSAKVLTDIMFEAGVPKGVLNLVTGPGSELGQVLTTHKLVKIVAFTGSTEVGIAISKAASDTLKRVSLELGGKNAVIVLKDADLEKAVEGIVQSAFATSGQRCTATSRVIVEKEVYANFMEQLKQKIQQMTLGNGLNPETSMGPIVHEKQLNSIEEDVRTALDEGGELFLGGNRRDELGGFYYEPTVITNVQGDHTIAQKEVFGPVVAVIQVDSYEEAIEVNNNTEYGLSTSIYTQNLKQAMQATKDIESGLVYINSGTSNAEMGVAFGGTKMSGNGHREVSHHVLDLMTEWKSVYITY
ncbi:MAG TPA: aldehyde dehydrogenase family protein [Paenisporosarcina sp.]|nr:aldehyde dehydrogenase family protein [Paenisporosarcina sp.]